MWAGLLFVSFWRFLWRFLAFWRSVCISVPCMRFRAFCGVLARSGVVCISMPGGACCLWRVLWHVGGF